MDDLTPELPSLIPDSIALPEERFVNIKLIGVGGGGSNAIDRLKLGSLERVHLAAINTDNQSLSSSLAAEKLLIGRGLTRGLGAGGDPELGRLAAEADREAINAMVRNNDLVVILAGMGGGTGSGAAPIVAEAASKAGALVIAFVAMPFTFEGGRRMKQGEDGLIALRAVADAVIPLPNDMLLQQAEDDTSVLNAFARGDEWIDRAVRSLWSILYRNGLINLDFATLREVFAFRGGKTLYGLGNGEGDDAVNLALEDFRNCPLLHTPEFSRKADRLLVNIMGGPDLTLGDVRQIMSVVTEEFGRNPHVAMGAVIDETWNKRIEICVIGTTDLNGRGARRNLPERAAKAREVARRAVAAATAADEASANTAGAPTQAAIEEVENAIAENGGGSFVKKVTVSGGKSTGTNSRADNSPKQQDEFSFAESEARGAFDQTDRTIFEGEDLDIPTFRRKGIKIAS